MTGRGVGPPWWVPHLNGGMNPLLCRSHPTALGTSSRRLGCAMRLQAVVRGHLARVIYGNVRKGLRTFFHAAEPRWRAVWTVHARGMAGAGSLGGLPLDHKDHA